MRWGDAEPGDLVEYKIPGGKKRYGMFLGIRTVNDDMRWLDILGEELDSIPFVVDIDGIQVGVRSALKDARG